MSNIKFLKVVLLSSAILLAGTAYFAMTDVGPPVTAKSYSSVKFESAANFIGGDVAKLVKAEMLHVEGYVGRSPEWIPFKYLQRKPITKKQLIFTTVKVHEDPGLRNA